MWSSFQYERDSFLNPLMPEWAKETNKNLTITQEKRKRHCKMKSAIQRQNERSAERKDEDVMMWGWGCAEAVIPKHLEVGQGAGVI
jgi:hypothetical protein